MQYPGSRNINGSESHGTRALLETVGRLGSGATERALLPLAGASHRRLRYGAPSGVLGRYGVLAKSGTLAPYNAIEKLKGATETALLPLTGARTLASYNAIEKL